MVSFLLKIHAYFLGLNDLNKYKKSNKLMWIICNVMTRLVKIMVFVLLSLYKRFKIMPSYRGEKRNNLYVSLTSFPKRIDHVWMTIDSICRQSVLPEKIILVLTKEEFPKGVLSVPDWLLAYKKYGLEILWAEENLKPHNKYFWTMLKYPYKDVITIDDDFIYRKDMIKRLCKIHDDIPNVICASNVKKIFNKDFKIESYKNWVSYEGNKPDCSHNYLALGYNGVFYPAGILLATLSQKEILKQNCLKADDLWLKSQEALLNIPVACPGYYPDTISIEGSQNVALNKYNNSQNPDNGNDVQWKNLNSLFNINAIIKKLVISESDSI